MSEAQKVEQALAPDRAEAERFITALAGHAGAAVTFQTYDDDGIRKEKRKELSRVFHGTLAEHWNMLRSLNVCFGAGVFVMVNAGDGIRHGSNKTCRTKKNVVSLRAVFADDDAGELTIGSLGVEPSIAVQS